jgi:hypothetical protein
MKQMARNVTTEHWGFLSNHRCLLHDRDNKLCLSFRQLIESGACPKAVGEEPELKLPCGKLGQIRQRGMFVEADVVRRGLAPASATALCFGLP